MPDFAEIFTPMPPPKPRPLIETERAEEYPVLALPPLIRDAVQEVADYVQAPMALIAASALAAVSTAVQTRFSVQRDTALSGPATLYLLTVAESGERKTAVANLFTSPIREWEAEHRKRMKELRAQYEAEKEDWERQGAELQRNIDSGFLTPQLGTDLDPRVIHRLAEPKQPRPVRLLRGDDTPEALAAALAEYPVATIISAEAGTIFGSHGMKPDAVMGNLSMANIMWDGGAIQRGRVSSGEMYVEGMKVTMGLQVQPAVLDAFVQKTGGLAKGIGYFARFLFCWPESTQGMRLYVEPPVEQPARAAFCERMTTLLAVEAVFDEYDRLVPHLIGFDRDAQRLWVGFHDEVEEQLGGEEPYSGIRDVASKAADNAARLACCFHVFAGDPSPAINQQSMLGACKLMRWYLDEAVRFARTADVTPEVADAQTLEEYLVRVMKQRLRTGADCRVSVNEVRRKGPNKLRQGNKRLNNALELLVDLHRVELLDRRGKKGADILMRAEVFIEYTR